jgi:hypothetical protein
MSMALPLGLGRRVTLPQAGVGGLLAGVAGSARAEIVLGQRLPQMALNGGAAARS